MSSNPYRTARQNVEEAERQALAEQRRRDRKCSWEDEADVREYRSEARQSRRDERLNKHVPDRVCPICQTKRMSSRQWVDIPRYVFWVKKAAKRRGSDRLLGQLDLYEAVAAKSSHPIVCRPCWQVLVSNEEQGSGDETDEGTIFEAEVVLRFKIDAERLIAAYSEVGMNRRAFARRCGWSESYQRKLETEIAEVNEDTRETILAVLREAIDRTGT
jgi:hypothetical protein